MRHRRRKLEVSTFPFLAVLLGAMGALILLLLVMDRRAKIVARAKLDQAAARLEEEEAQAAAGARALAAARRAQGDVLRQVTHTRLTTEHRDAQTQVKEVTGRIKAAGLNLREEEARYRELEERLRAALARLAQGEKEAAEHRAGAGQAEEEAKAAQAELARLTADLRRLEELLADLQAARQRDQRTYSLVPYRGKRGDSRRPLYVECTGSGPVFHPDRVALTGLTVRAGDIRAEVERRADRQRADGKGDELPYLLLLVRPDGIRCYYALLNALNGLKFDFGYEFIDADWVLDFPADDGQPAERPWTVAQKSQGALPPAGASSSGPGAGAAVTVLPPKRGLAGPGGTGSAEPLLSEPGASARGSGAGTTPLADARGSDGGKGGSTAPLADAPGSGGGPLPRRDSAGAPSLFGQSGDASDPVWPPLVPPSDPTGPGEGGFRGQGTSEPPASGGRAALFPDRRGSENQGLSEQHTSGGGSPEPPCDRCPENSPGARSPPPAAGQASEKGNPPAAGAAGEATQAPENPGRDPLTPLGPPDKTMKPAAPRPPRLVGNRDWVIRAECKADGVVLYPSRREFKAADLTGKGGDNPLAQAVSQMVERRQAGVQPGDPPYRPQVRFLIRPDGMRSFFLAFPMLEPLRVPMTRHHLEADEEVGAGSIR